MYEGHYVRLRAFESGDVQDNYRFMNDYETQKTMRNGIPFPTSYSDEQEWLRNQTSFTRGEYQFAIENLAGELVGRCGIIKLDWKNRVGELAIMIGKEHRGVGYGTDAMQLLINFCWKEMNLHKLKVSVFAFNDAAVRLYQSCGFEKEGLLRDEVFRDGAYRDVMELGMINPSEVQKDA